MHYLASIPTKNYNSVSNAIVADVFYSSNKTQHTITNCFLSLHRHRPGVVATYSGQKGQVLPLHDIIKQNIPQNAISA